MFGIINFGDMSPGEIGFNVSFLAVVLVALGYTSDVLVRDSGFGPPGNGVILLFGSAVGIAFLYLYYRFMDGILALNAFKSHMFDSYFLTTMLAASAGALLFFLLMVFLKRVLAD